MKNRVLEITLAISLFGMTITANADNIVNLSNGTSAFAAGVSMSGNAQVSSAQSNSGGSSLYFDGFSQAVLHGSALNLGASDFKISFDFMTSGSQNPWSYILFSEQSGGPVIGNGPSQYGGSVYLWPNQGLGPDGGSIVGQNFNDNQWHRLSIDKNQGLASLYVDNTLQGAVPLVPNTNVNLDGLVIGHVSVSSLYSQNWDNSFKGYIDNFSISTIAPSARTRNLRIDASGAWLNWFYYTSS